MSILKITDGTKIFYKDWGPKDATPIVFHHGWPLSADDWDNQMMFSSRRAIGSSPMTGAAVAAPATPTPATRWTPTPPMSLNLPTLWT